MGKEILFDVVYIFGPALQQRVAKTAYSFSKHGAKVKVFAEENAVAGEFDNYLKSVDYVTIPVNKSKLRRTPLGHERKKFICKIIKELGNSKKKALVIARDVNYGYIVGKIIHGLSFENISFIVDVADNYDLLYDSYSNIIKKTILKIGFDYVTKKAFHYSEAVLTVCPINKPRLLQKYPKELTGKKIIVLRNLPIEFKYITNNNKIPNSFVYVGKIDETSRDPMYILEKLVELPEFSIHFYSSQKKETIGRIKEYARELSISDRVIFHDRVPYDKLAEEISKYIYGLVPHKRCLITDYTLPNKMYDYRSSGVISIMSDCPSLSQENKEFKLGYIYSKEDDSFISTIKMAQKNTIENASHIPVWDDNFEEVIFELI